MQVQAGKPWPREPVSVFASIGTYRLGLRAFVVVIFRKRVLLPFARLGRDHAAREIVRENQRIQIGF